MTSKEIEGVGMAAGAAALDADALKRSPIMIETFLEQIEQATRAAIRAAINDKLEEAALEIEALERGVYTSAQTPAGLVRAMKVK